MIARRGRPTLLTTLHRDFGPCAARFVHDAIAAVADVVERERLAASRRHVVRLSRAGLILCIFRAWRAEVAGADAAPYTRGASVEAFCSSRAGKAIGARPYQLRGWLARDAECGPVGLIDRRGRPGKPRMQVSPAMLGAFHVAHVGGLSLKRSRQRVRFDPRFADCHVPDVRVLTRALYEALAMRQVDAILCDDQHAAHAAVRPEERN